MADFCYNTKISLSLLSSTILIIGGGFAGTEAALCLARKKLPNTVIRLLEPKTYFEYHAALYRFATGRSPMESCIPYNDIFDDYDIDVVRDSAQTIDLEKKSALGASGSHYHYDKLLLALGSTGTTFGIEGVSTYSFGMKSATEALRLKNHIDEAFRTAKSVTGEKQMPLLHIAVVGGGACGVEIAAELASYAKKLALSSGLSPSQIRIDLIEATERVLGNLPLAASNATEERLKALGVRVLLQTSVLREEQGTLVLSDGTINASTVIWTAGLCGHPLLKETKGLQTDRKGRVEVDAFLQAKGTQDVYVLGDSAATPGSGMAQTALHDGRYVAGVIAAKHSGKTPAAYQPCPLTYAVPVGPKWAVVVQGTKVTSGYRGWLLRRLLDLRVFLTLLPLRKALRAFRCGYKLQEEDVG